MGDSNQDVEYLQIVLNSDEDTQLADSGAGSPGNETQYFGSITQAGVIAFQEKYQEDVLAPYGLTEGTGYVGETTRTKLNELLETEEEDQPSDYTTEATCEDAGYYWYEEACHASEQEEEEFTGLKLSLANETPDEQGIAYNGQGVVYTTVKAEAGDEDVSITGATIRRTGLGSYQDIDKVYVTTDGVRHGSKRTLGSDNETELNFSSSASQITILAGQTKLINLVADMGATDSDSGHLNALKLTAIDTSASVDADLPIIGNYQEIVSISSPTLTFSYQGTTEDFYIGDNDVTVGEFELDNTGDENVEINALTLEQNGSADNDEVVSYTLYNEDDDQIAGPVDADAQDYVRFDLDSPLSVEENQDIDIEVHANIAKGRGETIALALEDGSNLEGIGVSNELNTLTSISGTSDSHDIQSGKLSLSEASDNPQARTVAPGTDDVTFLKADFVADQETVVVNQLDVNISAYSGNVEDLTVYLDDDSVAGPVDPDSNSVQFDSAFEVSGEQTIKVTADVKDDAAGDMSMSIESSDFGTGEVESLSGDDVSGSVYGSADGNTVTITSGSLTLDKEAAYGDQTVVSGIDDYKIGSFVLQAGEAEDIEINSYTVDISVNSGDSELTIDDISDLRISESSDVIGDSATSGNSFSVSQTLSANDTEKIYVYASVDSGLSLNDSDDNFTATLKVEGEGNVSNDDFSLSEPGQIINVEEGSFDPSLYSAGTPDSDIVVAEDTNIPVAEYKFAAQNDDYTIESLQFSIVDTPAMVTAMTVEGQTVDSFVNGVAEFSGLNLSVPKNDDITTQVKVDWNAIQDTDVNSGDATDFKLVGYKAVSDTTGEVINKEVLTGLLPAQNLALSGGRDGVAATYSYDVVSGDDPDLKLTAQEIGSGGDSITFTIATTVASTLEVGVSGDTITASTTGSTDVYDLAFAIDNTDAASALVDASVLQNGAVDSAVSNVLTGGQDAAKAAQTIDLTDTSWTLGDNVVVAYDVDGDDDNDAEASFTVTSTDVGTVAQSLVSVVNADPDMSSKVDASYATDTDVLTFTAANTGSEYSDGDEVDIDVSRPGSAQQWDSPIATNEDMYIYRTDLSVTTGPGSDYGSDLSDGDNYIMDITFAADGHNDLTVEALEMNVADNIAGDGLSNLRIEDSAGNTVASSSSAGTDVTYDLTEENANGETIPAGGEKTYHVVANVAGTADGDSFVVKLTRNESSWIWSDDADGQGTDVDEAVGYDEIDTQSYTIDR